MAYTFLSPAVRDGLGSYNFKEYTSAEVDKPPGRIRATRESRQEMFHSEVDDPTLEDRMTDAKKHRKRARRTRLVSPRTGTPPRSNANAGAPDNSRPASEETDATMVELDRKTQHEIRNAIPGSTKSWTQHEISGRNPRIHNGMKAAHCPKCPPTTRLS